MPEYFDKSSKPYGKTYGHWTVEWWRWALSSPVSSNPVVDMTGKFAKVNQPTKDVWYLAGKFGNENKDLPYRECTVPRGRAVLFPVINCEANRLEYPHLRDENEVLMHVKSDEDTIVKKECRINGRETPVERISSDPSIFSLFINEENALGVKGGGVTMASADGYWVFLKPLQKGRYDVEFVGSCEGGRLFSGARYSLAVL